MYVYACFIVCCRMVCFSLCVCVDVCCVLCLMSCTMCVNHLVMMCGVLDVFVFVCVVHYVCVVCL